jgi:S-adenosylmethionine-diacylglycerol 3-amino-3-carboxypropyl transferase
MLGVPRSQRLQIDHGYPGGIVQFVKDRVETVFGKLPLQDNYFWRVYLTGEYAPECCPAYLERESFQRLQAGLVDRIHVHTDSVLGFLQQHPGTISRYVLLDHMDWLYSHYPDVLQEEWQAIVDKAAPGTRLIWRSAGLSVDFVDPIVVHRGDQQVRMGELLQYDGELAARLHPLDRVNTYGSFYIAELMAA